MRESCSVLLSLHCHSLGSAVLWQGWLLQHKGRRKGGKREGKERKCADGPGQVSCGAASQALLAEVSIPFEWQEQIPGLGMAWVSGGSDQQRLLSHARAVLGSVAITELTCLLACFVSKHPFQGPGCSSCYQLALSKRGSPGCPSGC